MPPGVGADMCAKDSSPAAAEQQLIGHRSSVRTLTAGPRMSGEKRPGSFNKAAPKRQTKDRRGRGIPVVSA